MMGRQLSLFDPTMEEIFQDYHAANPHIFRMFERVTFDAIRIGFAHYGAKSVMERLRWHSRETGNDEFKINNNYASYYGRLFEKKHPEHKGFFRKRKLRA